MADPLSITASIIAVIQVTGKVVSLCYDYRSGLKNAPKEMKQLTDEITSLRDVLESILKLVDEGGTEHAHLSTLKLLTKTDGILLKCKAEMVLLEADLKPVTGIRAVARTLKWPFAREEVEKKVDRLGRLKGSLTLALATDHTSIALAIQDNTKQIKLQTETLAKDLETQYNREEYRRIKTLIGAPDPSPDYLAARGRRDPDSGEWLMKDGHYNSWKEKSPSLLWLHGIPGCGKTLLCSRVIDDLLGNYRTEDRAALAYFFFDFSTPAKQTYENALRSIVLQLSCQSTAAWQILVESTEYFEGINQNIETTWSVSTSFLLKVLDRFFLVYKRVYLIFDALDESIDQDALFYSFRDLMAGKSRRVNIFVTSRQERNIQQALETLATEVVSVTAETVDHDIRLHIKKRLTENQRFQKWPEILRSEIEVTLTKGALGMFKWVDCQLDRIQKCLKPSAVRTILGSLPKTLAETYTNIVTRIDEEYISDALTVFQWLIYSRRVLRLDEIAEVLAIEYTGEPAEFSPEYRLHDARDILAVCSSTITIVKLTEGSSAPDVRLAHSSVKDFLLAGGADFGSAPKTAFDTQIVHEKLADACLAYLLYLGSSQLDEASIPSEFPLADYAARHWMVHVKEAEGSDRICETARKLLRRDELCFKRLLELHDVDRPWRTTQTKLSLPNSRSRRSTVDNIVPVSPLYYASLVGLTNVVRLLLQDEQEVNESCGFFGDALSAAASQGHKDIVEILLQNHANADAYGGFQQTPLIAAVTAGHEPIVSLLLENGASVDKGHYRNGNALLAAIRNGHESIVRLLIKNGANVTYSPGKSPSPITVAASHGQEGIVELLLAAGAGCDEYIVETAARSSHEKVAQMLRAHLAGPQAPHFQDPLSSDGQAASSGSKVNIRHKGATTNPDKSKASFLQNAAAGGLEDTVRQLLDSGIDVNYWELYQRGTALSLAASHGHVSVVKLLLERGADVNLQPDPAWTLSPIDAAARKGHLAVIRTLLQAQPPASVAVNPYAYGNPLESAAYSGNLAVFQEILACNPDVDAMSRLNDSGGTALAAAAAVGHETMVKLLLDRGADVNLTPSYGSRRSTKYNPLASAAYGGHVAVAQLLLDAGADIELLSGWRQETPLAVAVGQGQISMVEFLLDANGNQTFDSDALKAAVSGTHENTSLLRLLLNRFVEISKQSVGTEGSSSNSQSSLAKACTPALLHATKLDHQSSVRELLHQGAEVNGKDHRGYTALHEAAHGDLEDMAKILTHEYHADLHSKLPNGSLPIHIAAQYGSDKCVKFFLDQNVHVDTINDELRAPLHTAVDNAAESTVSLLLAAGARLDLPDEHGMTALDIAEYHVAEEEKKSSPWRTKYRGNIVKIIVEELKKRNPEIPTLT